ncbi:two-component sensor histidine kinase [Enterococcus saigonensis]|uniref:Two-component sensor histidine kinase n=1 Tax=Enterococcus saigonensis TaxID=1805431 RepID=A0A679IHL7_9ENTE|nr:two-component sensor histidine kinase [Enterococcus saigonensis]
MAALCVYTADSNYRKMKSDLDGLENRIMNSVEDNNDTMSFIYMELAGSNAAIANVQQYLNLSAADYFEYTQDSWQAYQRDTRISETINGFFNAFNDLDQLYVTLDGSKNYLMADSYNHNGRKLQGKIPAKSGFVITRPIVDQYGSNMVGEISAVFSRAAVLGMLENSMVEDGMEAYIFDNANNPIFTTHNQLYNTAYQNLVYAIENKQPLPKKITDKYYVLQKKTSRDLSYVLLASKQVLWQKNLRTFAIAILVGSGLAAILLITLNRTFKRYFQQIETIVGITHSVAEGNLQERIDVSKVQDELYDLSEAINFMVASLDQYIKDNYELEIKQRDAHMQALQSQINPHFLYNTLEYIRMYALSKQQKELADVVYAFSALLRNNTTQEKTTTLKKELSFCEKYVYLYQMRYPDRVAYNFVIAPELENLIIPKFTIQPLIENYFVHGIDYTRNDNAISVKANFIAEDIVIRVTDNGKGMTPERVREVQNKLKRLENAAQNSIGLHNVYARLQNTFGLDFSMVVTSQWGKGTTLTIKIKGGRNFV